MKPFDPSGKPAEQHKKWTLWKETLEHVLSLMKEKSEKEKHAFLMLHVAQQTRMLLKSEESYDEPQEDNSLLESLVEELQTPLASSTIIGGRIMSEMRLAEIQRDHKNQLVQQIAEETRRLESSRSSYSRAMSLLDQMFRGPSNYMIQREELRALKQAKDEQFFQFAARVKNHADFCSFDTNKELECAVKEQVMSGSLNSAVRRKLYHLNLEGSTLRDMITKAQEWEDASEFSLKIEHAEEREQKKESVFYAAEEKKTYGSNAPEWPRYGGPRNNMTPQPQPRESKGIKRQQPYGARQEIKCWNCGRIGHRRNDQECPARGKTCGNCGTEGHFRACCPRQKIDQESNPRYDLSRRLPQSSRGKATPKYTSRPKSSQAFYINELKPDLFECEEDIQEETVSTVSSDSVNIACMVGGVPLQMIIDSGCKLNIIPEIYWKQMKEAGAKVIERDSGSKLLLKSVNAIIPVLGKARLSLEVNKVKSQPWFVVTGEGEMSILGKDSSEEHKVLKVGPDDKDFTPFSTFKGDF